MRRIAVLAVLMFLAGCGGPDGGFAIYRVKGPASLDQSRDRLGELPLERVPVLGMDDIVTYSRAHRVFQTRGEIASRFSGDDGRILVVVASGERISPVVYRAMESSRGYEGIATVTVFPGTPRSLSLFPNGAGDPTADARVLRVLAEAGKLSEQR